MSGVAAEEIESVPDKSRDTDEFTRDALFRLTGAVGSLEATVISTTTALAALSDDMREMRSIMLSVTKGSVLHNLAGWQKLAGFLATLMVGGWVLVAGFNGLNGVVTDPSTVPAAYAPAPAESAEEKPPPTGSSLSDAEVDRLKALAARLDGFIGADE